MPKFNEDSIHFITTRTHRNTPYFLNKTCCDILVEEVGFYRKQYRFKILGYVILPEHLHLLVCWDTEGNKDLTISKIMHGIKGKSANRVSKYLFKTPSIVENIMGRQGFNALPENIKAILRGIKAPSTRDVIKIWQPGFYDFNILYQEKFLEKLNYLHNNSLNDKRIRNPENYLYSSRLFYETGKGILTPDSL